MKRQGCRTRAAAKQLVSGVSGASWVFGTHFGGISPGLAVYVVVLELLLVVLSRAEQGVQSLSTNTSTMTWQSCWVERGSVARAGGS
jgi:uncharacterized membrane protein